MRTIFRGLLLFAPLVVAAPQVSHAAFSGLKDDGSSIYYYGANSDGNNLSFSFDDGAFATPPVDGALDSGTIPNNATFTMQIDNPAASAFTQYRVLFEANGEVVAGFTDVGVADGPGALITLVYDDYLAEGAVAPTPSGSDTIIDLDATGSVIEGANGGATNSLNVRLLDLPVPEPASMAILGTGLAALGLRRRRRA